MATAKAHIKPHGGHPDGMNRKTAVGKKSSGPHPRHQGNWLAAMFRLPPGGWNVANRRMTCLAHVQNLCLVLSDCPFNRIIPETITLPAKSVGRTAYGWL